MADIITFCVIGVFTGLLAGLLGVGGSIIMIPALTEVLGPKQHLYQAAAMIVNFCVVVPATIQHWRAGAVMGAVVRRMVPMAVVAVGVGVLASEFRVFQGQGQAYLIMLFGAFILYIAGDNVYQLARDKDAHPAASPFDAVRDGWKAAWWAGVPTGFLAGLLGIGGGVVCVPIQNRLLGIPLRNAIANSATTIIALSLIGAIGKNYALDAYHEDYTLGQSLTLAAALMPTAVIGSLIGSALTHRLPPRMLRAVLMLFLFAASIRMIEHGWSAL
jgi:uncharacterized membrane protein YfcA